MESQLRSCLLALWLGEEAGLDPDLRRTIYWVALLRYIGCTAHAHEVATLFGDEIAIRAQTLVHDAGDPAEVMRDVIEFATAGRDPAEQQQIVEAIHEGAHEWAVHNFASGCEAGDLLVEQLGFGDDVRHALGFTFERWNGKFPHHAAGADIPTAMLVVHVSHDMEAIGRRFSPGRAITAARDRSGSTYEPGLAELFVARGAEWFERLEELEPWDTVLELEPAPRGVLRGDDLDEALTVVADFIDLKSPFMHGHSRRCARLAGDAAAMLGLDEAAVGRVRRAALVHELGTTAIPNSILDKPASLTRAEQDRVELHPLLTEQMLRRSRALHELAPIAATHHEACDGSGYHKGLKAADMITEAMAMAAADVFVG